MLIVDDSTSVREALTYLLEEEVDIEVVGGAANGQDALGTPSFFSLIYFNGLANARYGWG